MRPALRLLESHQTQSLDCDTVFLREGNIQLHRQSSSCIQKQQQTNHLRY